MSYLLHRQQCNFRAASCCLAPQFGLCNVTSVSLGEPVRLTPITPQQSVRHDTKTDFNILGMLYPMQPTRKGGFQNKLETFRLAAIAPRPYP